MNVFFDFPLLSSFVMLIAMFAIVRMIFRLSGRHGEKLCVHCGQTMPWNAVFCRRCGQKLGN
jgi:predicted amidophosphoribosyltransferase